MATKNIAITEGAYKLLVRQKRQGESFSKVIEEHFRKKGKLTDYAGVWSDMSHDEWQELTGHVEHARKGLAASLRKRIGENR